jgi:hypothetical protein
MYTYPGPFLLQAPTGLRQSSLLIDIISSLLLEWGLRSPCKFHPWRLVAVTLVSWSFEVHRHAKYLGACAPLLRQPEGRPRYRSLSSCALQVILTPALQVTVHSSWLGSLVTLHSTFLHLKVTWLSSLYAAMKYVMSHDQPFDGFRWPGLGPPAPRQIVASATS